MSQKSKFNTSLTLKKGSIFDVFEKPKKFKRNLSRSSERSERSHSSMNVSPSKQGYIKSKQITMGVNIPRNSIDPTDFYSKLSSSMLGEKIEVYSKINRASYVSQQNSKTKIKSLQNELQIAKKSLELLTKENKKLKSVSMGESKKRQQLLEQNNSFSKKITELGEKNTNLKNEIQNLQKEREHQKNQIEVLSKNSLNKQTQILSSFREHSLEQQLNRCKKQLNKSKKEKQIQIQGYLQGLNKKCYTLENQNASLKLQNQTIMFKLARFQKEVKDLVRLEGDHQKLKIKYKNLLIGFRDLQKQYKMLKNSSTIEDQSSSLSLSDEQLPKKFFQ